MRSRVLLLAAVLAAAVLRPIQARAEEAALPSPLTGDALVHEVLARNPLLQIARAGLTEALARQRRAGALDDPMLSYSVAPLSIAAPNVDLGQEVRLEQRFPFFGKRGLQSTVARAEAAVAEGEVGRAQAELVEVTHGLFADYYLATRALEVNASHRALVEQMRSSAQAQYVAGQGSQQDPLEAELELADLERERAELEADLIAAHASLNALLHRGQDAPLPPPVARLETPPSTQTAARTRPELEMRRAELEADEQRLQLAKKTYLPDFSVMASYNSMWSDPEHRAMVGIGIELPLQLGRRRAEEDEARATLRRRQLELGHEEVELAAEAQKARARFDAARTSAELYRAKLVPLASARVEAARASYVSGMTRFNELVDAERKLRSAELGEHRALAELWRRKAELDRALGQSPGSTSEERR